MYRLKINHLVSKGLTWRLSLFILSLIGLPFVIYHSLLLHAEDESLRLAKSFSTVISTIRSYYGTNVANKVLEAHGDVSLTEDYKNKSGAIPIPATLSIELGEILREKANEEAFFFSFVSDMPFKTRDRKALDEFQEEALRKFRQNIDLTEYWIVEHNERLAPTIRYATPVRMETSCVKCHNSHPASPLQNWKLGDVRGIQDVAIGVSVGGQAASSAFLGVYLVGFILLGGMALGDALRANKSLKELIQDKQASEVALTEKSTELEKSIRELSVKTAAIEKAPFGIAIADFRDGRLLITDVNETFLADSGYVKEELLGRDYRLLEGPHTDQASRALLQSAISKRHTQELELELYRKDGSTLWSRVLLFPTYDSEGAFQQFIVCQSDITELKESESMKSQLLGELQESLKLESLGLTIAGISHDLNTPIGVAITATSHLESCLRDVGKRVPLEDIKETKELLSDIDDSIKLVKTHLGKAAELVASFKKTSADAARSEWREINLKVFFQTLLVALSPITKRSNCKVSLECNTDLTIYTEPGSLSQAITNLLINATTHAFSGIAERKITIVVSQSDATVEISVADNGIGIPSEVLAKLFTPFFTTNRAAGGSGLGLFSVKRVVDHVLNGKVTVWSQRGVGTTFTVTLPAGAPVTSS